ncbi:hypothetical protein [Sphingomonas sp. OK281]|uniref:hypothetical protein n=1 Tax=Sphingomonas sp. OK281 TaxID=1881067 RepID=UPI00111413D2|nr:hypothetical protein [Sphingomonas sp. OK281]
MSLCKKEVRAGGTPGTLCGGVPALAEADPISTALKPSWNARTDILHPPKLIDATGHVKRQAALTFNLNFGVPSYINSAAFPD